MVYSVLSLQVIHPKPKKNRERKRMCDFFATKEKKHFRFEKKNLSLE